MIWLDFFIIEGHSHFSDAFFKFERHFSTPAFSPLSEDRSSHPHPCPIPTSPQTFQLSVHRKKICIVQFFVESISFGIWNLIKHASIWGQQDEGRVEGGRGVYLGLKICSYSYFTLLIRKKLFTYPANGVMWRQYPS